MSNEEELKASLNMREKYRKEEYEVLTRRYEIDCVLKVLDLHIKELKEKVENE